MDFAVPTDHWSKLKESEQRDKCIDLVEEKKTTMEYDSDGDTSCNWSTWNNPQRIVPGTGRLVNKRTNGDHSDNSIIKIGQNTKKSLGPLR